MGIKRNGRCIFLCFWTEFRLIIVKETVRCLLCGNDIGPFRLLRDSEFCSSTHRKRYSSRLGMALGQLIIPELVARKSAGFKTHLPLSEGRQEAARADSHFAIGQHEIQIQRAWTLPITRLLKDVFLKTGDAQPSPGLAPLVCLPAQPPILAAASLLLGSAPPAQAALGAAELAVAGP